MITKLVLMMMAMMMAKGGNVTKNIENRDETRVWLSGYDVHTHYTEDYEIGLFDTMHIDRDRCGSVEIEPRVLMLIYCQTHGIPGITMESLYKDMGIMHYYDEREDYVFFNYVDEDGVTQCVELTDAELDECAKCYYMVW